MELEDSYYSYIEEWLVNSVHRSCDPVRHLRISRVTDHLPINVSDSCSPTPFADWPVQHESSESTTNGINSGGWQAARYLTLVMIYLYVFVGY